MVARVGSRPVFDDLSYAQLLRQNPDFRRLWGGQIVSQLGDWFNLIYAPVPAAPINRLRLLVVFANAGADAPAVPAQSRGRSRRGPISPPVGDGNDRPGAGCGRAGYLLIHDRQTTWLAFACYGMLSSLTVFFEPARQAIIPNITRPEELVAANALSAVTWSLLLTSGALVGGIVTTYFGREFAFVLNSLSFVGSALFIRGIRVPSVDGGGHHEGGFRDVAAGFRYSRAARADGAALCEGGVG